MNTGIIFIVLPFIVIASVMAYLITYNEWLYHYPTKKEPRKIALKAAIFTFVFFIVIGLFYLYTFAYWIEK